MHIRGHHVTAKVTPLELLFAVVLLVSPLLIGLSVPWLFVAACILAVIFIYTMHPTWAAYSIALFAFFHSLEVNFAWYPLTANIPVLSSINAPLVDFIALAAMMAVGLAILDNRIDIDWSLLKRFKWGIALYALFIVVGGIAALGAFDGQYLGSLKYLARPMFFVFLAYVLLPLVLIREKETFEHILDLWGWIGLAIGIFGLTSFFAPGQEEWLRVQPYSIGPIAPLGTNHNLLAEPLVILLPLVVHQLSYARRKKRTRLLITVGIMALAAFLTLSRAAWIAMFAQVFVASAFFHRRRVLKAVLPILKNPLTWIAAAGITVYMVSFLFNAEASLSSTSARYVATEQTVLFVLDKPFVGYGPGTYAAVLGTATAFTYNFGDPLDSHGFLQKVAQEEGLIGLAIFILFLLWFFTALWDEQKHSMFHKPILQTVFLMALGIVLFELFNTSYFNSVMWMPIGMGVVAMNLYGRRS